jgi:pyruvate dehydrogenase E2 component (dihydrolipoamide acetyltransferase)
MSQTQVTVPDLGGIDEVEVIEISIKVGDTIEAEQEIIVLESDKATMEVPAPMAGKIAEILVSVGDKVSSGTLVVTLESNSEQASESAEESSNEEPEVKVASPEASKAIDTPTADAKNNEPKNVEIKVPDLGGAGDVEVIELSASIGDNIDAEESLLVLESDKATMEVPAPDSGQLVSFAVKVGDKVNEGDVIGVMSIVSAATTSPDAASTPKQTAALKDSTPESNVKEPAQAVKVSSETVAASTGFVHAGPAVRQLAREMGVDLTQVSGTGPRNRIVKEDVQAFVKTKLKQPVNQGAGLLASVIGSSEDFSRFGPIEHVPLNKIKQVTAKNMVQSWSTIPQVTQFDEADITDLEGYRKGQMAAMLPEGVKVSPLAFVLKACVLALQKFPNFNASLNLDGTQLITKQYYNLGIAVETPDGLLVPVIKDADKKSLIDFAKDSAELAGKARDKKLPMDGMMGGTFTISSLGGIGGTAFTPIVSAPQVAILGVSKAATKPVWDGEEFKPRLMLPISLSYDHRVIDGAEAARFARYICQLLGDTRHMLL